jgi:phosphoenolpyruvate carboxylase
MAFISELTTALLQRCISYYVQILGKLAEGLRSEFSVYSKGVFKVVYAKMSDKKCIKQVCETLDQLYTHSLTLDAVVEDVCIGLDPKKTNAAHARVATLG